MNRIREIFAKPIERTIEEVIKVQQADEKAVLTELDEYVPTDFLQEQYARVFEEIASAPSNPPEGIGIKTPRVPLPRTSYFQECPIC
jgi:hypothetical protein